MRIFERNIRLIREIDVIFGKPDIIRHLGHTVELFTVVGIFFMYFAMYYVIVCYFPAFFYGFIKFLWMILNAIMAFT